MMALLSELKILIHLGQHLNIVNLLGAVTKEIRYGLYDDKSLSEVCQVFLLFFSHSFTFFLSKLKKILPCFHAFGGCRGRDRIVVGFTTTYAIGAYHH